MKNNILNKKRAFTILETLMVIAIIGIIVTLTVFFTINSNALHSKKILALSKLFYSNIDLTYQNILSQETRNYNIQNIKNHNTIYNTQADSEKLKNLFAKRMNLTDISCDELVVSENLNNYKNGNLRCASSENGVKAGFYLDRRCENSYQVAESLQKDNQIIKTVEKACGYVIYSDKKSNGILGQDVFIIGLGKYGLK